MNWTKEAENELRKYRINQIAYENVKDDIRMLRSKMESTPGGVIAVAGNKGMVQDRSLSYLTKLEELEEIKAELEHQISKIEKALEGVGEEERALIDVYYFQKKRSDDIADILCISKSQFYRKKDAAIKQFTIARYGRIEQ